MSRCQCLKRTGTDPSRQKRQCLRRQALLFSWTQFCYNLHCMPFPGFSPAITETLLLPFHKSKPWTTISQRCGRFADAIDPGLAHDSRNRTLRNFLAFLRRCQQYLPYLQTSSIFLMNCSPKEKQLIESIATSKTTCHSMFAFTTQQVFLWKACNVLYRRLQSQFSFNVDFAE